MTDNLAIIRAAQAAYEGALAAYRHSPNADTARIAGRALAMRDWRLEQLWAVLLPHERAAVDARPIKVMVQV